MMYLVYNVDQIYQLLLIYLPLIKRSKKVSYHNFFYYMYSVWIIVGQEIVSYENPKPTSGIHRVIFVLFRQPCRHTILAPGWRQKNVI